MTTDAAPLLAATGTLRPADPERIVLKRAVLTGYPHRVHKRKAVIRFMFHNPEDVRWFRPLELWTKYGRHGRIREPLGTHGSLKAAFDGVLQQRDTVCASLYKRIFPKMPPPGP
jgi:pre-rRNA-processing protein TSR1